MLEGTLSRMARIHPASQKAEENPSPGGRLQAPQAAGRCYLAAFSLLGG